MRERERERERESEEGKFPYVNLIRCGTRQASGLGRL